MFDQNNNNQDSSRIYGVLPGQVTDVNDAKGMGRILVRFHTLASEEDSYWARIATLYSGNDRGILFRPEVGDEVLCTFEHGDIQYPYVLGGLWNGQETPPDTDSKNNVKMIVTRSGHKVTFDDKPMSEKIEIENKSGHKITFNNALIEIKSKSGQKIVLNDSIPGAENIQIETTPTGKVEITSQLGTVEINCLNANINAIAGLNITAPITQFSGILQAQMIITQTIIANAVLGSSYTPGPGNTFGL